ncbi:MAG: tetratricopeptide repeat protein, partial [Burkholderiales bacterium]
ELGDKTAAIQDYNKAIQLNPQYAVAYNNRGTAKADLGDKTGAIQDYTKAIEINPQYAKAYYNRGNVKAVIKDKMGAYADLEKAERLYLEQGDKEGSESVTKAKSMAGKILGPK